MLFVSNETTVVGNTLTFKVDKKKNKIAILYVKHALVTLLVCNLQERANDKRILIQQQQQQQQQQ